MQRTTLIHLQADEGMWLTNGSMIVKAIDIGPGQSEDDWSEITEAAYAKLRAKMTPREFILRLLQRGITRAQIEAVSNASEQVWAELNYATTILRSNPLLDQLCGQFGLTTEDVDDIFGLTTD